MEFAIVIKEMYNLIRFFRLRSFIVLIV